MPSSSSWGALNISMKASMLLPNRRAKETLTTKKPDIQNSEPTRRDIVKMAIICGYSTAANNAEPVALKTLPTAKLLNSGLRRRSTWVQPSKQ